MILSAAAVAAVAAVAGVLAGAPAHAAAPPALTIYVGQHEQMARLTIHAFEKKTGISVKTRYADSAELGDLLVDEGSRTPASVFWAENSPQLMRLQKKSLLAPVDEATLRQIPARYSSNRGDWVGVVARENVLTYNPKLIKQSELPASILGFEKPKWKDRVGIHLTSVDIMPLIHAISVEDGRPAALKWVEAMKRNARLFQSSDGVQLAVHQGAIAVGISNSYYYYRLREQLGRNRIVSRVQHFSHGNVGGLINVSGAAVLRYAPHPREGQKFLAFLVSRQNEQMLASSDVDFEYPLRADVKANPQLRPFDELQPPHLTVEQLGDDSEALALLREAGVL
ncbi:MAG TPA: extracellular solute-binding protein [Nevskiaceae bacterium]